MPDFLVLSHTESNGPRAVQLNKYRKPETPMNPRLHAYEPDLFDAIRNMCQHRPDYPVETEAMAFCDSIAATSTRRWHEFRRICDRDDARPVCACGGFAVLGLCWGYFRAIVRGSPDSRPINHT